MAFVIGGTCMAPGPLSAAEPLSPPGDCTEAEHRELKQEVGRACKATSMKCYEQQDCATLIENWLKFQRCIDARLTIMNKCFRGGDKTHQDEIRNYRDGASTCSTIMIQNRCPQQCG
jgi:hypothetical protein